MKKQVKKTSFEIVVEEMRRQDLISDAILENTILLREINENETEKVVSFVITFGTLGATLGACLMLINALVVLNS